MAQKRTRRGRGRPEGGSDEIVRAVLRATLDQLGRRGFASLSVEAVAKAAGVNKTSVYRRWPTKAELVVAAVVARRDHEPRFEETGCLREDLVALLRYKARSVSTPRGREIAHALITLDEPMVAALTRELRRRRYTVPRDVVEHAMARGELPPTTDAAFVTELLMAPIYYRALVLREPVPDELIERTVDHVLASLARPVARDAGADAIA
jgi:AcrR family transcriptional regulator